MGFRPVERDQAGRGAQLEVDARVPGAVAFAGVSRCPIETRSGGCRNLAAGFFFMLPAVCVLPRLM
ncbi:MAG: hypothetical protein LBL59_03690 [Xanthomonadaceae bacterium]|nr:hypothetical protein [Xanthomonadaceae bacterium]